MNYVYILAGILAVIFACVFVFYFLKRFQKKAITQKVAKIEEEIDPKTSFDLMMKKMRVSAQEENYRQGIIYAFYSFRIICDEELLTKRAKLLPPQELIRSLAGTPNLSLLDVRSLVTLYEKARFSSEKIVRADFVSAKRLLEKIRIDISENQLWQTK